MLNKQDSNCVLTMISMVFNKIHFDRLGFKNNIDLDIKMNVKIGENEEQNLYNVVLSIFGTKKDEYKFSIELSGIFSYEGDEESKSDMLNKNAVAILMPYIRSQISLLTAQPDTDSVVLPIFNISNLMEQQN